MDDALRLSHLHALLDAPLARSLLRLHPNDVASDLLFTPPDEWRPWWDLHTDIPEQPPLWSRTLSWAPHIPGVVRDLVLEVKRLQLPRPPVRIDALLNIVSDKGMSPKKTHEVSRMATYIIDLLRANHIDPAKVRIVDVGAGQGYLTRTLKYHLPSTHILALDADEGQTVGAQRWEERVLPKSDSDGSPNPPISHRTTLITPETLVDTVDKWIKETLRNEESIDPVPVLLIGLHACGSLTPYILRAFIALRSQVIVHNTWTAFGVVAVGCCYNLLNAGDFPLSKYLTSFPSLNLPVSAYHLAAQIPAHWFVPSPNPEDDPEPFPSVALAIRKVTWRALLAREFLHLQRSPSSSTPPPPSTPLLTAVQKPQPPARWTRLPVAPLPEIAPVEGTGITPEMRRLGRLRDGAYTDWEVFLKIAGGKMDVDFFSEDRLEKDGTLERRLEVLHTLRCLLGPAVESLILLDRVRWLREELGLDRKLTVDLVNLFDQATGSGRNVGIVIAPMLPSYASFSA
ncbi:methyltransferase domain-containing protein [Crucibulum laeve]|uniref:Methyltransferase domain-containing protein n=1 Tax=Crucibulum laeve TaxID=68775 RepID=A0A5C3M768_9AGAR|nr:methyltransferase domain-containing protein [Crucibulum laeve]